MTILQLLRPWIGTGLVLGAINVLAAPSDAQSQAFPSGPIRIFVPTAPSTPPDIISRVIAAELSASDALLPQGEVPPLASLLERLPRHPEVRGLAELVQGRADALVAELIERRSRLKRCHGVNQVGDRLRLH